jgi:hypothetical protein
LISRCKICARRAIWHAGGVRFCSGYPAGGERRVHGQAVLTLMNTNEQKLTQMNMRFLFFCLKPGTSIKWLISSVLSGRSDWGANYPARCAGLISDVAPRRPACEGWEKSKGQSLKSKVSEDEDEHDDENGVVSNRRTVKKRHWF